MRILKSFGQFWYDFIIGDDWKIAAAVLSALGLTASAMAAGLLSGPAVAVGGALTLLVLFAVSVVVDVRRS